MSSTAQAVGFSFVEQLCYRTCATSASSCPPFRKPFCASNARCSRPTRAPTTSWNLELEPALAARLLRIANSAEFRRMDQDVTDLRKAVSRMGFNMVRSVAVAFAMRQLRRRTRTRRSCRREFERAWNDSLEIAAACFVIAKRFTRVNPDQALLTGLLHVLGPLVHHHASEGRTRSSARRDFGNRRRLAREHRQSDSRKLGLPEAMQHASSIRTSYETRRSTGRCAHGRSHRGEAVDGEEDGREYPALRRIGVAAGDRAIGVMEEYADELKGVKSSLSE